MNDPCITLETAKLALKAGAPRWLISIHKTEQNPPDVYTTQTSLQKWLRDGQAIHVTVNYAYIDSETEEYIYDIKYYPWEKSGGKRVNDRYTLLGSFHSMGGTYTGGFDTYELAMEAALQHGLKLIGK